MIDKQFIVERQGRQFVLYQGLLNLAHEQGLKRVTTKLIQLPDETNGQVAVMWAEVETERGTFSGIGDASPANVARAMLTATIRLAETRAKARALRDAVNVGVAALEELGEDRGEEMPTPARIQGCPSPVPTGMATDVATPAQRRAIGTLARERGIDPKRAGVDVDHLSKSQAAGLIERWQKQEVKSA